MSQISDQVDIAKEMEDIKRKIIELNSEYQLDLKCNKQTTTTTNLSMQIEELKNDISIMENYCYLLNNVKQLSL